MTDIKSEVKIEEISEEYDQINEEILQDIEKIDITALFDDIWKHLVGKKYITMDLCKTSRGIRLPVVRLIKFEDKYIVNMRRALNRTTKCMYNVYRQVIGLILQQLSKLNDCYTVVYDCYYFYNYSLYANLELLNIERDIDIKEINYNMIMKRGTLYIDGAKICALSITLPCEYTCENGIILKNNNLLNQKEINLLIKPNKINFISSEPYSNSSQKVSVTVHLIYNGTNVQVIIKIPKSYLLTMKVVLQLIEIYEQMGYEIFIFICSTTGSNQSVIPRLVALHGFTLLDESNFENNTVIDLNTLPKKTAILYVNNLKILVNNQILDVIYKRMRHSCGEIIWQEQGITITQKIYAYEGKVKHEDGLVKIENKEH